MSLNLNGSSSPLPSKAVSRLYFRGSGLPAPHPVQREVQEFCIPPDNKDPLGGPPPLRWVLSHCMASVQCPGSHFRREIRGVDCEPGRERLGPGMEIGR